MKKYLMTGIAALAIGAAFVSCSHEIEQLSQEELQQIEVQKIKANYEQAFIKTFGQPASNQDWGFGASNVRTRAITVPGTSDTYSKFPSSTDVASKFPKAIPTDADELPEKGDYNYYFNNGAGHNYKIVSAGTYTIGGGWQNTDYNADLNKTVPNPYNVYVSVEGNDEVLIKHSGSAMHNLYILKGNVKLDTSVGEMANVVISVASGATLTDTRDKLSARTDLYGAIELYNKGTFYATNSKYDMGNKARFYNEGTSTITGPLTYSPADAEASFFVNQGDGYLHAPSMTLNSAGNFYNEGTVDIDNATTVTNDGIFWVNAGHYTTGSMVFSAKNTTFYNYCNLIVTGNAHMYDGTFNLMNGSYTEAGSADMDNFVVNMGSNTGMNILGNLGLTIGQGDGTYQGFITEGTNDFLRVGGTVTVAAHMLTLELTGDITYAFNNLVDLGANNSGVQPTYRFNEGTKEASFEKLTVTPNTNNCGATWKKDDKPADLRIIAEDLSVGDGDEDFDFNDVVIDVYYGEKGQAKAKILAAGGTLQLTVDGQEVHDLFATANSGKDCAGKMINTNGTKSADANVRSKSLDGLTAPEITFKDFAVKTPAEARDNIVIKVYKNGNWIELDAVIGKVASKVRVGIDYTWKNERQYVGDGFKDFVSGQAGYADWYKQ